QLDLVRARVARLLCEPQGLRRGAGETRVDGRPRDLRIPPGDARCSLEEAGRLGLTAFLHQVGETAPRVVLRSLLVTQVRLHHPAGAPFHSQLFVGRTEGVIDREQLDEALAAVDRAGRRFRIAGRLGPVP